MKRRTLLGGIAAIPAVALPIAAKASTDDAITWTDRDLRLIAELKRITEGNRAHQAAFLTRELSKAKAKSDAQRVSDLAWSAQCAVHNVAPGNGPSLIFMSLALFAGRLAGGEGGSIEYAEYDARAWLKWRDSQPA